MDAPRRSGLLLHLTSLPGPFGMGDFGPAAYRFADQLAAAGQKAWQILPIVPPGHGHSPYSSPSTFALSPLLVSPERLVEDGLLDEADLQPLPDFPANRIAWEAVLPYRHRLLERAFARYDAARAAWQDPFWYFASLNAGWLDDYALFMALSEAYPGQPWTEWPAPLRDRDAEALAAAKEAHDVAFRKHQFWQFLADRQWRDLHAYASGHGLQIIGDLPIYVAHDSADVWACRELFKLHADGTPYAVSGVPPDYFSETGQRWGNPLYRWFTDDAGDLVLPHDAFGNADAYAWWVGQHAYHGASLRPLAVDWWTRRLVRVLNLVDVVRLDHFRGFAGYWEIPADAPDARSGYWMPGPGAALFDAIQARTGRLPVIAEDLGLITPDVPALMQRYGWPGMAVVQFGFDGNVHSPHFPGTFHPNLVAYSGTHDNDTLAGWLTCPATQADASRARAYFGASSYDDVRTVLERLLASPAGTVIFPVQDVLGLGSDARMNVPGHGEGQWGWRLREDALSDGHLAVLREMTERAGR